MGYTSFCLESYLNYVGDKSFEKWNYQVSPLNKLKIVAERIGIQVDYGIKPYQSIKLANKFRNVVAHGRIVTLASSCLRKFNAKSKAKNPETWWESVCTIECAKSYPSDLEEVINKIETGYHLNDFPFGILQYETRSTKPAL